MTYDVVVLCHPMSLVYNIYTCSGNTMSAEEEKKNVYQLVYHSHLGFRIAAVQHLLLEAGVSFVMEEPEWGEDFRVVANNPGTPVFAPPVIRKGDFTLSQSAAIMHYLGSAHGFLPTDAEQAATCLQLVLDVSRQHIIQ